MRPLRYGRGGLLIGGRLARVISLATALLALAAIGSAPALAAPPTPWMADIAYDADPLTTLDIYRPAGSYADLPFVMFIHAGGWFDGDKKYLSAEDVASFTRRGIVLVAINYRNIAAAQRDRLFPPLLGPLQDAKRALQFLRYHAQDFALDATRAALWGDSAGAFDALWLGLPSDRADPAATDPLRRMSTRVSAIGVVNAQTTIDPAEMRDWIGPKLHYGGQAFGLAEKDFEHFLAERETFAPWFPRLSPTALVGLGSPPLYLLYTYSDDQTSNDPMAFVHSPRFGEHLAALAQASHVPATLRIGDSPHAHRAVLDFLAEAVTRPTTR